MQNLRLHIQINKPGNCKKVNHHAFFNKLVKRKIPSELLCILENWFPNCWTCITWKDVYSAFFKITFGVRQGLFLSPLLFCLFIDDIINRMSLRQRCQMVLCADDILIIALSVNELQHLVNICEIELAALDMLTNAKKSCCLRIDPRHNKECSNITTASGYIIPWVDTIRYLGIYITRSVK